MIVPKENMAEAIAINPAKASGGFGTFERYLSVWVALCMVAGIGLGKLLPGAIASVRGLEFVKGSQINAPIAVLIWLMITPMMMKVDFSSVKNVGKRPVGLLVTLFINWVVKPFSMALLAWAFSGLFLPPSSLLPRRTSTLQAVSFWPLHPVRRWYLCGVTSPKEMRPIRLCKCRSMT
jgi:hypothetical protein